MPNSYEQELKIAVQAVRQAAQLCRAVREQTAPGVIEKKDKSPVTVADYGSQALVCRAVREAFADDPIVGEEDAAALRADDQAEVRARVVAHVKALQGEGDDERVLSWIDFGGANEASPRFWTLDPIDGTKGFLRNEQYAIALGLIVDGQLAVGVLGCPNLHVREGDAATGVLFTAVKGQGAFVRTLDEEGPGSRIRVTDTADPAAARFCESVESGHSDQDESAIVAQRLGITRPPVRMDSQCKYATVARGEADIYLRLPTRKDYREKIWDHAAGALVITEAGGRVTDMLGRELNFAHGPSFPDSKGVIATNGRLHDQVLKALEGLGNPS